MKYVSKEDNMFRVVRKKYNGPPLQTKSGEWIKKGDQIIKIHLHNYRLAKIVRRYPSQIRLAVYLKKTMEHSLKGLCDYVNSLPDQHEIKAIIGTTMLTRGAERFGFATHDVPPSLCFKWKGFLYKFIYLIVHPHGFDYIQKHGKRLKSKHLVMSVHELFQFYLR